jgi:hypothetical protein
VTFKNNFSHIHLLNIILKRVKIEKKLAAQWSVLTVTTEAPAPAFLLFKNAACRREEEDKSIMRNGTVVSDDPFAVPTICDEDDHGV